MLNQKAHSCVFDWVLPGTRQSECARPRKLSLTANRSWDASVFALLLPLPGIGQCARVPGLAQGLNEMFANAQAFPELLILR
jgi:hypothetical protein